MEWRLECRSKPEARVGDWCQSFGGGVYAGLYSLWVGRGGLNDDAAAAELTRGRASARRSGLGNRPSTSLSAPWAWGELAWACCRGL